MGLVIKGVSSALQIQDVGLAIQKAAEPNMSSVTVTSAKNLMCWVDAAACTLPAILADVWKVLLKPAVVSTMFVCCGGGRVREALHAEGRVGFSRKTRDILLELEELWNAAWEVGKDQEEKLDGAHLRKLLQTASCPESIQSSRRFAIMSRLSLTSGLLSYRV